MDNYLITIMEKLSSIDNSLIFGFSIIPYSIFLTYLFKNKDINKLIRIGFSLTLLFVLITIILSIFSLKVYGKTLVEVDILHGSAEAFLTLSDFVILFGFINLLKQLEVKNS